MFIYIHLFIFFDVDEGVKEKRKKKNNRFNES